MVEIFRLQAKRRVVTPAQAGVQDLAKALGSRFHGNDVRNTMQLRSSNDPIL
jgi:hypothetical protein